MIFLIIGINFSYLFCLIFFQHYSDENQHPFPLDLAELCKMITSCFDFEDYIAQASIVNFYHMDSTLAPHTDHSEKNLDAPLISIRFAEWCIFIIYRYL